MSISSCLSTTWDFRNCRVQYFLENLVLDKCLYILCSHGRVRRESQTRLQPTLLSNPSHHVLFVYWSRLLWQPCCSNLFILWPSSESHLCGINFFWKFYLLLPSSLNFPAMDLRWISSVDFAVFVEMHLLFFHWMEDNRWLERRELTPDFNM